MPDLAQLRTDFTPNNLQSGRTISHRMVIVSRFTTIQFLHRLSNREIGASDIIHFGSISIGGASVVASKWSFLPDLNSRLASPLRPRASHFAATRRRSSANWPRSIDLLILPLR
jgi:hypothetical protein